MDEAEDEDEEVDSIDDEMLGLEGEDALDDSVESEVDDVDTALVHPRRINYLALDKPVKDRVIGQTTYRINKKQAANLASKASKDSRNKKEILLHARGPKPGMNRGQVKKSFF